MIDPSNNDDYFYQFNLGKPSRKQEIWPEVTKSMDVLLEIFQDICKYTCETNFDDQG